MRLRELSRQRAQRDNGEQTVSLAPLCMFDDALEHAFGRRPPRGKRRPGGHRESRAAASLLSFLPRFAKARANGRHKVGVGRLCGGEGSLECLAGVSRALGGRVGVSEG